MSFDLINPSTHITRKLSRQSWSKALELAQLYGWRPMGTRPPRQYDFQKLGAEWDGRYLTNDGQIVHSTDAASLAAALERSLADIPDTSPRLDWSVHLWRQDPLPEWLTPDEQAMIEDELQEGLLDIMGLPARVFFAGRAKRQLADFIRFCRLGSFEIL